MWGVITWIYKLDSLCWGTKKGDHHTVQDSRETEYWLVLCPSGILASGLSFPVGRPGWPGTSPVASSHFLFSPLCPTLSAHKSVCPLPIDEIWKVLVLYQAMQIKVFICLICHYSRLFLETILHKLKGSWKAFSHESYFTPEVIYPAPVEWKLLQSFFCGGGVAGEEWVYFKGC